jgi:signal transduction histidine kinase
MTPASSPVTQPAERPSGRPSWPQPQEARTAVVECVVLAVACLITYELVTNALSHVYSLSRDDDLLGGMWAVLATIFVLRDSLGQSVAATVSRMSATLVSFVLCLIYLAFLPFHPWALAMLVGASALAVMLLGRPGDAVTAGITTAVVMVVAAVSPQHAWQQPILRLADTIVGVAVGALAAWTGIQVNRLLSARSVPLTRPRSRSIYRTSRGASAATSTTAPHLKLGGSRTQVARTCGAAGVAARQARGYCHLVNALDTGAGAPDGGAGRDPPDQARLGQPAEEQAALRRVATLVARATPPQEAFAAVAEEVGRLLASDFATLVRYDPQDTLEVVGTWTRTGAPAPTPVGGRLPLGGRNVTTMVYQTGQPARIDYSDASGVIGQVATRDWGLRSSIGVPVSAESRLWGCMVVAFSHQGLLPLPTDTEAQLAGFTELVATAIANTESRASLARLAEEQAALRRVATLVAQGVPPVEIFSAVSDEVARLFRAQAAVLRFEHDGPAIVFVGVSKTLELPVGTRWEFQPGMASAEVYRTGSSARVDAMDWPSASGPVAGAARRLGVVSSVVSPIVVEGRVWGAMSTASTDELLPSGTEGRLEKFTGLLATAIANAESRSELAASRRRIVAASDQARRRIERDLHDGTQQRLVSLALAARAAEGDGAAGRGDLRAALSRIAAGLADAAAELQEFSRGIHPAILSERGLGPALRALARRSAVPVDLEVTTNAWCPEPVETAAYYVASEALANAMKHAQASRVEMSLTTRDGRLLSIRDDGVGGADPGRGSGLAGLADRVEALGGSIRLHSAAGAGTHITVDLPLERELAQGVG